MQNWSVHTVSLHDQPGLWDTLHAASADATVFSSTPWLTVMARAFQRRALGFVLTESGTPAAGIPLLFHKRGPLRIAGPLPITLYAGLLRRPGCHPGLAALFSAAERYFHFMSLSAVTNEDEESLLCARGWRLRAQQSIRIPLGDMNTVWEGYNQSLRRKLRRASEIGFQLDDDPPTGLIVRMFEQSYLRHGKLPPIPGSTIDRWVSLLRQEGMVRCFAARHADGRSAAVRVVIRNGDVLYDWLAGADPSVAPSSSHWLVHSLMQRFSDDGCILFDFMGANTPGVTDFKRGFGGETIEYHEAEWYRPAVLRHFNTVRGKRLRLRRGFR